MNAASESRGRPLPAGLKPLAGATKPGTQRVPGRLNQATQVAFVTVAEGFGPAAIGTA